MTPEQIELVQSTWAKVGPSAKKVAKVFYSRFFAMAPHVKPMFTSDMTEQGEKLMQMIAVAIKGLPDLDALAPMIQELGLRHDEYKVQPGHYDAMGEALLWTLEQQLGDEFTPDVKDAWNQTFGTLATWMKEAAVTVG